MRSMQSPVILKLKNIRKVFPGVVALDNIHFVLRKGEVHIILGENGAGKSTLIKILSGAYRKTSGQVLLSGEETEIRNPKHAQQIGISVINQELNLVPFLTVGENIFLGREPVVVPGVIHRRKMIQYAQKLLNDLGVNIPANRLVKDLGVGQQQMVEVAKALSFESQILIMDEPTSALTEIEIKELFGIMHTLKKKGISIIYISHRLEELFEIGDRVTVLRDGKYIGSKNIENVDRHQLIKMMAIRELKEKFPLRKSPKKEEVLRVENLTRKGIFKDISFNLHQGEIVGLTGLMGSGRTELARALFGIDHYQSGKIILNGIEQKVKSPRMAIRKGIGFLPKIGKHKD